MNAGIVLSLGICIVVLTLRYMMQTASGAPQRSSPRRRIRMLRLLVGAAIALAAVGYRLQRHSHELDGRKDHEPSMLERIIMTLSR